MGSKICLWEQKNASVDKQIYEGDNKVLLEKEIWRLLVFVILQTAIHNLDDEDKRDTVKNHISKLTNFVLFAQTLISNMLFWSKISQCEID